MELLSEDSNSSPIIFNDSTFNQVVKLGKYNDNRNISNMTLHPTKVPFESENFHVKGVGTQSGTFEHPYHYQNQNLHDKQRNYNHKYDHTYNHSTSYTLQDCKQNGNYNVLHSNDDSPQGTQNDLTSNTGCDREHSMKTTIPTKQTANIVPHPNYYDTNYNSRSENHDYDQNKDRLYRRESEDGLRRNEFVEEEKNRTLHNVRYLVQSESDVNSGLNQQFKEQNDSTSQVSNSLRPSHVAYSPASLVDNSMNYSSSNLESSHGGSFSSSSLPSHHYEYNSSGELSHSNSSYLTIHKASQNDSDCAPFHTTNSQNYSPDHTTNSRHYSPHTQLSSLSHDNLNSTIQYPLSPNHSQYRNDFTPRHDNNNSNNSTFTARNRLSHSNLSSSSHSDVRKVQSSLQPSHEHSMLINSNNDYLPNPSSTSHDIPDASHHDQSEDNARHQNPSNITNLGLPLFPSEDSVNNQQILVSKFSIEKKANRIRVVNKRNATLLNDPASFNEKVAPSSNQPDIDSNNKPKYNRKAIDKTRRNKTKIQLDHLQEIVPNCKDISKPNVSTILEGTLEYIMNQKGKEDQSDVIAKSEKTSMVATIKKWDSMAVNVVYDIQLVLKNFIITFANHSTAITLGYTIDCLMGMTVSKLIHPDDFKTLCFLVNNDDNVLGKESCEQIRFFHKCGYVIKMSISCTRTGSQEVSLLGKEVTFPALNGMFPFLGSCLLGEDMLSVHDTAGVTTFVSPSWTDNGFSILGCSPYVFYHEEDIPRIKQNHLRLLTGSFTAIVYRMWNETKKQYIWVESRPKVVTNAEGETEIVVFTRLCFQSPENIAGGPGGSQLAISGVDSNTPTGNDNAFSNVRNDGAFPVAGNDSVSNSIRNNIAFTNRRSPSYQSMSPGNMSDRSREASRTPSLSRPSSSENMNAKDCNDDGDGIISLESMCQKLHLNNTELQQRISNLREMNHSSH